MRFSLACVFIACMHLSCTFPTLGDTADRQAWQLKTEADAAIRTISYFPEQGLSFDSVKNTARVITLGKVEIPFLKDSLENLNCWTTRVQIDLILDLKEPIDLSDNRRRVFDALLDAETGRLVRVSCVRSIDYPGRKERLAADSAEKILLDQGELICGLADKTPNLSLIQALNYVIGSPLGAKEIYIWYVNYARYDYSSKHFEDPHPVWWIDLRGIPPIDDKEPPVRNMRTVIDSQTGIHILSTNRP